MGGQCNEPGVGGGLGRQRQGGRAMVSNAASSHWILSDSPPAMQRTQLHLAAEVLLGDGSVIHPPAPPTVCWDTMKLLQAEEQL